MNYRVFFVGTVLSILFLFLELPLLAVISFGAGVFGLVYTFAKWKKKKVWEEVKNAEPTHPKEKFESYTKGFSKQSADFLIPPEGTEYNHKGALHKTPQLSKNFFTELKELFK